MPSLYRKVEKVHLKQIALPERCKAANLVHFAFASTRLQQNHGDIMVITHARNNSPSWPQHWRDKFANVCLIFYQCAERDHSVLSQLGKVYLASD